VVGCGHYGISRVVLNRTPMKRIAPRSGASERFIMHIPQKIILETCVIRTGTQTLNKYDIYPTKAQP